MRRPEQGLQIGIFNMLKPLMAYQKCRQFIAFHVPNGMGLPKKKGRNGKWYSPQGAIFKAMGLMPGVADIILLFPEHWVPSPAPLRSMDRCPQTIVFVEVKALGETQREDQENFQAWVTAFGFEYVIIEAANTSDAWNQMRVILRRCGVEC